MVTPQSRYEKIAQAYAGGARELFSTPQSGLAAFDMRDPARIEAITHQASRLVPISNDLTGVAAERLEGGAALERAEAATQLLGKALVDFQISAFLLQTAIAQEQGAAALPDSDRSFDIPASLTIDEPLAIILGQEPLAFGRPATRPAAPTHLPAARALLIERIAAVLEQIETRSGRTAQHAVSGLLAMGVGQVAQAAGLVGMNLAQALGAAEKASQLYALVRQFFHNAYQAITALLGPSLTKTATNQVVSWVNDILQGEQFIQLLKKMYETSETQQELHWRVEASPAGLEEHSKALLQLDELDRQHQKQIVLIDKVIQVLRFVPAAPAAALPQGQLLLGATYLTLCGYVIFAGADYVDAPTYSPLDRVPGPREIIRSSLGEPSMESSARGDEGPWEASEPETDRLEENEMWTGGRGFGFPDAVRGDEDMFEAGPPEEAGAEPEAAGSESEAPLPPPAPPADTQEESHRPPANPPSARPNVRSPAKEHIGASAGEDTPKGVQPGTDEEPDGENALIEELVRLDLAVPKSQVVVDQAFEIAVAIRQPSSTLLTINGLDSVHSADGTVYREASRDLVRYKVRVSAPDCIIETGEYTFLLRAGQDSPPRFFQLTPRRAGELSIIVTAFQEDDLMVAQTRVRIQATVQAVAAAPISVEDARAGLLQEIERARSESETDNPLRLALYRALCGPAFSLADLEEMCFILDLDWDLLEGETKDRKARAMIRYFSGRADLSRLNQAVKDARPHLSLG